MKIKESKTGPERKKEMELLELKIFIIFFSLY